MCGRGERTERSVGARARRHADGAPPYEGTAGGREKPSRGAMPGRRGAGASSTTSGGRSEVCAGAQARRRERGRRAQGGERRALDGGRRRGDERGHVDLAQQRAGVRDDVEGGVGAREIAAGGEHVLGDGARQDQAGGLRARARRAPRR